MSDYLWVPLNFAAGGATILFSGGMVGRVEDGWVIPGVLGATIATLTLATQVESNYVVPNPATVPARLGFFYLGAVWTSELHHYLFRRK